MRIVDGGMGLSLEIPQDFQTSRMGDALRVFSPQRERTRSPTNIMITTTATQPALAGGRAKRIKERTIHYLVRDEPGGSGGEAVRLLAWVESNGRFIMFDSVVQPEEGGDRDFRAEWAMLPTAHWQQPSK